LTAVVADAVGVDVRLGSRHRGCAEERVAGLLPGGRCRDVDDTRRSLLVDLVNREALRLRERGGLHGSARELANDGRLVGELAQRGRAAEHDGTACNCGDTELDGAASPEGAMHALVLARAS